MFKSNKYLDIIIDKNLVGKLALGAENICVFEYDKKYIESGFSISPFYLPLKSGVFIAKQDPFDGLFGVFSDSLPDGWLRLVIDRLLQKNGINPHSLNQIDRLAIAGKDAMGAIEYSPENKFYKSGKDSTDINYLAKEVNKVLNENYSGSIELLAQKGGSSAGARPKVLLNIDNEEWLVKFPNSNDNKNIGKVEYQYSIAAKDCGIIMPETKLFEGKYFGVKRFDRERNKKIHMHSFAGLLHTNYRIPSLDYADIFKATMAITNDMSEVMKVLKQMMFNIITHNRDDHAKNFSLLYKNNKWEISPAYDLVYSQGFNGQHTTTINGNGLPDIKDIVAVADTVGIKNKTAIQVYDEIKEKTNKLLKYIKKLKYS